MNNLKRVLSVALTGTMLAGMMVMGASAADVSQFTDGDEITHVEAVNVMSALGVLQGKDTGAFDPNATVTRAEMAKIITVMLNGGSDITTGTAGTSMYSDVAANHWARSYIEYCSSMGIIAGQGDGTFNPDGPVTGAAAAKMLLVALGYDPDIFGFTGIDWEINVNRIANTEAKLYEEIATIDTSAGLTRDNTAQMAYNALEAKLMVTGYDKVVSTGEISYTYSLSNQTFLNKYFSANTFIGTYVGNADTDGLTAGFIKVNGKLDTAEEGADARDASFPSGLDISNIGEEVKVIFKDGKSGTTNVPDKNDTIYGVFNTGKTEVINVTKNDVGSLKTTEQKIKINGTKYDLADEVKVVTNYVTGETVYYGEDADGDAYAKGITGTAAANSDLTADLMATSGDTIKFVCDDDGKINAAYVVEFNAGRVTAVTSSKVTIAGLGSITIDGNDIYEDIAKDDVVVYTMFYSDDKDDAYVTVVEAESVEGELSGYKFEDGEFSNVVVDDDSYTVNEGVLVELTDDAITTDDGLTIGDTVAVYLMNGMVVGVQSLETSGGNYAVITDTYTESAWGTTINPVQITVMYTDGSEETLAVHKSSTYDGETKIDDGTKEDQLAIGNLVEYSMSGGKIKIKNVVIPDEVNTASVWDKDSKSMTHADGTAVAATASTLFVNVDGSFYAYNLRSVGTISQADSKLVGVILNADGQVRVAYVEASKRPSGSTNTTLYGIITAKVGTVKVNDVIYTRYTVYVNTGDTLTVNSEDTTLTKGAIVYFDETSDACYGDGDVKPLSGTAVAVRSYSDSAKLLSYYTGTQYNEVKKSYEGTDAIPVSVTVSDDVIILYVDKNSSKGGDEIGVNAFDVNTGYANALVYDEDGDGIIDVIVVETSGEKNLGSDEFAAPAPAEPEEPDEDVTTEEDVKEAVATATADVISTIKAADVDVTVGEDGTTVTLSASAEDLASVTAAGSTGLFKSLRTIENFEKAVITYDETSCTVTPDGSDYTALAAALENIADGDEITLTVTSDGVSVTYTIVVDITE